MKNGNKLNSTASNFRNSNVELLRIVSIIMIISMHLMSPWRSTSNMINREFIIFLNVIFNTSSTLFILISGYYGLRFKVDKLIHLWFMALTYTVPVLVGTYFFEHGHTDSKFMFRSVFPVLTNFKWFLTSYIILYSFSPFINRGIERLEKRQFILLISIFLLFFYLAPTILFMSIQKDTGKGILNMLAVYCIGRYLALYGFPAILLKRKWTFGSFPDFANVPRKQYFYMVA